MNNLVLSVLWGILYLLCAGLGVLNVTGLPGLLACLAFFVPPAVLLYRGGKPVKVIRVLSALWLGVTLALLVLNILSVVMSKTAGTVLYYLLAVLSSPMVCGGYWIISLFGWACLFVVSLKKR